MPTNEELKLYPGTAYNVGNIKSRKSETVSKNIVKVGQKYRGGPERAENKIAVDEAHFWRQCQFLLTRSNGINAEDLRLQQHNQFIGPEKKYLHILH